MRNFLSLLGKIFLFIVFIVLSQLPLLLIESHYSMGIIAPLVILCYLILIGILQSDQPHKSRKRHRG